MGCKKVESPIKIDEQINNLKLMGLIIEDEENAKSFLRDVSYFRLIKAFSLGLKPKNGKYDGSVTFDQIKSLYLFNSRFRQLLFVQIEKVEVNLRCRLSEYFGCKYGNFGYYNPDNYADRDYHQKLLDDIDAEVIRNDKAPFVKNFRVNYENGMIPLYALIELFSFGTLSKFLKNMKNEDKKEFARTYYGIGYTYLESWIEHIAYVRNICAHYGRIYNAKYPKTPILYVEYANAGIGNNRAFASLLCLKHLLPNNRHWKQFLDEIELLIEKYPAVDINTMRFPVNWKEILIK